MKQDFKKTPTVKKPRLSIPNTQISLEDSQTTTNYIVITSIIIGAIILVGGYFIYNLTNNFLESSNRLKALDKQKSLLETKKNNLETLNNGDFKVIQNKRDGKTSDADLIMRALPYTEDQKNLYAMLEAMTKEAHISLLEISQTDQSASSSSASVVPAPTPNRDGVVKQLPKPVYFTVTIQGPYVALLDFLANTEKSSRVINFRKMKLDGSSTMLKAQIDFVSYYQDKADISDHQEDLK